jgi:DNA-directed RNA polymerase alpha subunit
MNKEEMLDHFALHAMTAQIQITGIKNPFEQAEIAYRMATQMVERRNRIHAEWAKEQEMQQRYKAADLHELNLPVRYHRCLASEDILMKQDLCNWTERDLRKIPNLGAKGVQLVKEAMAAAGLKLKGQSDA